MNAFAVNNSDIVEALTRSSSAMSAANNSFEQTVALATAATEITRDSASVGNALKTISMRIRGYDEETEEYSEDIAELTGEIADLTKTASTPGGISLFTDETKTEYRSTYDILADIAGIWDEITDKNQAELLETLFGKQRAQVGAALLSNFEQAEAAMDTMAESAGSAEAEMENIMDGIEYKLNALQETWTGVAQNLFQSDDIKAVISVLQLLSNAVEAVTGDLGLFGSAAAVSSFALFSNIKTDPLLSIPSALKEIKAGFTEARSSGEGFASSIKAAFSRTSSESLANINACIEDYKAVLSQSEDVQTSFMDGLKNTDKQLAGYLESLNGAEASLEGYEAYCKAAGVSMTSMSASAKVASVAMGVLKVAMNAVVSLAIGWAISKFLSWLDGMANKAENLRSAYEDLEEQLDDVGSQLEDNYERIAELQKLSSEGKITLVEQEELDKLKESTTELAEQNRLLKENAELAAEEANNALVDEYNGLTYDAVDSGYHELKTNEADTYLHEHQDDITMYEQRFNNTDLLDEWNSKTKAQQQQIEEYYNEYQRLRQEAENTGVIGADDYVQSLLTRYETLSALGEEATAAEQQELEDVRKELVAFSTTLSEDYIGNYVGEGEDLEYWQALLSEIDAVINPAEHFQTLLEGLPDDLQKILNEEGGTGELTADRVKELAASYQELSDWMKESGYTAEDVAKQYNSLAEETTITGPEVYEANTSGLSETMSNLEEAYELAKTANEEIAENGTISSDTLESLKSYDSDGYTQYLEEENGLLTLNTELLKENAEAKFESEKQEIQAETDSLEERNAWLEEQIAENQSVVDNSPKRRTTEEDAAYDEAKANLTSYTAELEENNAAIAENQQLLTLYDAALESAKEAAETSATETVEDALADLEEAYSLAETAVSEMAESGGISSDTKDSLLSFDSGAAQYLYTENGQLKLNVEAWKEYREAKADAVVDTTDIKAEIAELDKQRAQLISDVLGSERDVQLGIMDASSDDEALKELQELGAGGSVDVTIRPVIDTSELRAAGWDGDGDYATILTSTYSNEAGTVAINFTPIMVDENGNYTGTLSPEELQEYAEEVIAGTREDDLNLQVGAEFTGEDAIAQADAAAQKIHEIHEKVSEEQYDNYGTSEWLADAEETYGEAYALYEKWQSAKAALREDNTNQDLFVAEESALEELKQYLEDAGVSWEDFLNLVSQVGGIESSISRAELAAESLSNAYETAYDKVSDAVESTKSEISAATSALSEQGYGGSISQETYNALIAQSDDWADTLEYENGVMQLNTEAVQEMIEAKVDAQVAEIDLQKATDINQWKENAQAIADLEERYDTLTDADKEYLESLKEENSALEDNVNQYNLMKSELEELTSAYQKWQDAQSASETGDMYDDALEALEQIQDGLDTGKVGTAKYKASVEFLVPEAKQEDVQKYVSSLERYLTEDSSTGVSNFVHDMLTAGLMVQEGDVASIVPDTTVEAICEALTITPEMAKAIFGELEEYGFEFEWTDEDFDFGTAGQSLEELQQKAEELKAKIEELQQDSEIDIDVKTEQIETAQEELSQVNEEIVAQGGTAITVTTEADTEDTEAALADIAGDLDNIAGKVDTVSAKKIGDLGASKTVVALNKVVAALKKINNTKISDKTVTVKYTSTSTSSSSGSDGSSPPPQGPPNGGSDAYGTDSAVGGKTLVGELGTELVVSDGRYYTVGEHGAEFVSLKKGDIVFNHEDTEKILKGLSGARGKALAEGNAMAGISGGGSLSNLGKNTGSSSSSSSSSSSEVSELSDELEEQIEELEEELSELISSFEHQITMLERHNGSTEETVAIYRQMQEAVHAQAEKYRALGLDENSEYIQELQEQWWEYNDSIRDTIVQAYEDITTERENAITLTENWLENALNEQNIPEVKGYTDAIIQYYREMQENLHEEAEYYRSQGYDDTSDEVSALSDLWWEYEANIKEMKQQVIDDLLDIVDTTSEAVDEIQNVYDTLKDAAEEYETNGGYISVDALQDIISLGPEYMQYLEDENGLLVLNEENINKVIAAKTEQLAVDSAMSYIERLRLAMESDSIEDLNQLLYATTESTDATWGLVYANLALLDLDSDQYEAALHNINAIRALAQTAIDGIGQESSTLSDSLNEMKDGLDDILQYVMDMLRQRIEDQIDSLEDMKDAYAELIDLKKESLEASKDEADYQKTVSNKLKEIAKLQAKIDALSLDDSREAQAEKAELLEEMAELQEDLADVQADEAVEAQESALDDMQEAYEDEKDAEIEVLEESISSYQKLYDMAIEYIRNNWDTLYSELISFNTEYGLIDTGPCKTYRIAGTPLEPHYQNAEMKDTQTETV